MQPGLDVTGVVEVIGRALVGGRFDAVGVGLGAALLRHVLISNAPRPGLLDVIAPGGHFRDASPDASRAIVPVAGTRVPQVAGVPFRDAAAEATAIPGKAIIRYVPVL